MRLVGQPIRANNQDLSRSNQLAVWPPLAGITAAHPSAPRRSEAKSEIIPRCSYETLL